MSEPVDVEGLRKLLAAATPGLTVNYFDFDNGHRRIEDARAIAAAVNALPALLDELTRLRAVRDGMRDRAEVGDVHAASAATFAKLHEIAEDLIRLQNAELIRQNAEADALRTQLAEATAEREAFSRTAVLLRERIEARCAAAEARAAQAEAKLADSEHWRERHCKDAEAYGKQSQANWSALTASRAEVARLRGLLGEAREAINEDGWPVLFDRICTALGSEPAGGEGKVPGWCPVCGGNGTDAKGGG